MLLSNRWRNEWMKDIWSPQLFTFKFSSFVPPYSSVFYYLLESLKNSWNVIFRCIGHPDPCLVSAMFSRWPVIWWNTYMLTDVLEYWSDFLFTDTSIFNRTLILFSFLWGSAGNNNSHFTDQETEAQERAGLPALNTGFFLFNPPCPKDHSL